MGPVRRCASPVEQTGFGQNECASANGYQAGAACRGVLQRREDFLRDWRVRRRATRDDDGVRFGHDLEAPGDTHGRATYHRYETRCDAAEEHPVVRDTAMRFRVPENEFG